VKAFEGLNLWSRLRSRCVYACMCVRAWEKEKDRKSVYTSSSGFTDIPTWIRPFHINSRKMHCNALQCIAAHASIYIYKINEILSHRSTMALWCHISQELRFPRQGKQGEGERKREGRGEGEGGRSLESKRGVTLLWVRSLVHYPLFLFGPGNPRAFTWVCFWISHIVYNAHVKGNKNVNI